MISGLYSIEGFTAERGRGHGGYGLTITLAAEVVEAFMRVGVRRDESRLFYAELLDGIRNAVQPLDASYARLDVYEDTWILLGMRVGSDCACFNVGGHRREELGRGKAYTLRYDAHNIDTPEQAAAIVSTWLLWFNHMIALTDLKQPHTIS